MNWTSKEKQKFWNKAYQNYMNETGLSARELSNWIKTKKLVDSQIYTNYTES